MKKLLITLCGIAVISGLSNFAYAEENACPKQFTPEMKAKMEQKKAEFDQRLNLTPEQKQKMKAIHESARVKIQPLFEKMKVERAKLEQLKTSGAAKAVLMAQHEKVKQIRAQMKVIRQSNFEQIQAILTLDQQKEFNKMHEEHMNERKNQNQFEGKKEAKN